MKSGLLALLVFLPGFLFAQVVDSLTIIKEVDSLIQVSRALTGKREYEKALEMSGYAEKLALDKLGQETAAYGRCCFNRGRIFYFKSAYAEAEKWYIETKTIQEKVLGKDNADYAISLNNLAALYVQMGNYDKAQTLYLESLDIRRRILGKEHPDYATSLNNLAILYFNMGNYDKAQTPYLESLDIRGRILGKEHPDYLNSLNNLANLYIVMGDYERAEPFCLLARDIRKKTLGIEHPDYASSLNTLAVLYLNMGNYDKSEQLQIEDLAILEKVFGKDNLDYASALNNLAVFYWDIGNYEKAEILYIESKSIREKNLGKKHLDYAESLNNLAILLHDMKKYESAEKFHLESNLIYEQTTGREHPYYAMNLNNLAMLYDDMGDYDKAITFYTESNTIWKKTLGAMHPDYATSLNNMATYYLETKNYEKAKQLYIESKSIWENAFGIEHPDYARSLRNLAYLYWSLGDLSTSKFYLLKASAIEKKLLQKASYYLSEREMSKYIFQFSSGFNNNYSFAQIQNELLSTCYDNTLFHKGFLLNSILEISKLSRGDTSNIENLNLLKSYNRRLTNEYSKPIAERDSIRLAEWEEKANATEKELTRNVAGFGEAHRQVSWQEIRAKLQPGSAAIEFVSYRYYKPQPTDSTMYAALVLLPAEASAKAGADTTPHFIPLFEERQLQVLLNRPGLSEKLVLTDLYGNSPELRRLLWDPLEPLLHDVKTIYYSPSGLLHRLNPAALLDESNQTLSEGRQWVRVGSTRELVTGRLADRSFALVPEGNTDITLTAMVYGGITYDMDSLAFAAANPAVAGDSTENPQRKDGAFSYVVTEQPQAKTSGTRGNPDGTWSSLTATGQEADQISALLTGAGFSTMKQKGFSASEEQFKQIGVGKSSPRILHIATHGFSYPDPKKDPPKGFGDSEPTYKMMDDPMLRSGLLLAGANYYWKNKRPLANCEDGVLVAYEVRDLNLRNTELAVLSACQTGLGDVVGSEGVYGLQRAFRIAGVKFLIVSLWEVPDEQTQELMRLFYHNWLDKKESLRDAFNHAQQTLRETEPSPYMWAGFVLIE